MEMTLWKELSRYLNFTWKLVEVNGKEKYGAFLDNGTFVGGFAQALKEGTADVSFCNIWQRNMYLSIMDFGPVMSKISLTFLVRRPQIISDRWKTLFGIFLPEVWLITLTALFAVSIMYWWSSALLSKSSHKTSLIESLLVMFGVLTVSSSRIRLVSMSSRILVLWWFFFTLLLTTAITGTIVTRLTLPLYTPRINSFRQLVQGDFYWVLPQYQSVRTSLSKEFYFNLNNPWQKKFESKYKQIEAKEVEGYIKTDDKLVIPAQRCGNEYVIVHIDGVNDRTDLSKFRVMRASTRNAYTSFGFRKGSPYNELFVRTIQDFIDCGLWLYWRKNTDQAAVRKHLLIEKDITLFSRPEQLTLQKLYPVFLILIIGNCVVCLVFFTEIFW